MRSGAMGLEKLQSRWSDFCDYSGVDSYFVIPLDASHPGLNFSQILNLPGEYSLIT